MKYFHGSTVRTTVGCWLVRTGSAEECVGLRLITRMMSIFRPMYSIDNQKSWVGGGRWSVESRRPSTTEKFYVQMVGCRRMPAVQRLSLVRFLLRLKDCWTVRPMCPTGGGHVACCRPFSSISSMWVEVYVRPSIL